MQQLSSEDTSAEFERLYENYKEPITRYFVVGRGYEKEDANDYYQDIFLNILENSARKGTPLPQADEHRRKWLYRIARNHSFDVYRHNKLVAFQHLPDNEEHTQLAELMVEGLENRICDRDRLQEVLAQMPLRYQQCVLLIDRGFKQKEIAARLGISAATVSEILRDIKTQLRKYYPVAHSLQREISSFHQDFDELYRDVFHNAWSFWKQPSNIGRSVQYELQQLEKKQNMGLIKCNNALINIQTKFGKKSDPLGDIVVKKMNLDPYLNTAVMADVIDRIEPDRDLCNEWIRKLAENQSTLLYLLSEKRIHLR